MSSSDVFPARNLGSAEDWGRKVENRTQSAEQRIEALTQSVNQLTLQVNSLAGSALPGLSKIPTHVFQSSSDRDQALTTTGAWVPFQQRDLLIPDGTYEVIVDVSGTLQLTGTSHENDAPWVRASVGFDGGVSIYLPDPATSQGVRAASNWGAVFLATISASVRLYVPPGTSSVSVQIEAWAGTADFATSGSSNLSALFTHVTAFPERVVSSGT